MEMGKTISSGFTIVHRTCCPTDWYFIGVTTQTLISIEPAGDRDIRVDCGGGRGEGVGSYRETMGKGGRLHHAGIVHND